MHVTQTKSTHFWYVSPIHIGAVWYQPVTPAAATASTSMVAPFTPGFCITLVLLLPSIIRKGVPGLVYLYAALATSICDDVLMVCAHGQGLVHEHDAMTYKSHNV